MPVCHQFSSPLISTEQKVNQGVVPATPSATMALEAIDPSLCSGPMPIYPSIVGFYREFMPLLLATNASVLMIKEIYATFIQVEFLIIFHSKIHEYDNKIFTCVGDLVHSIIMNQCIC